MYKELTVLAIILRTYWLSASPALTEMFGIPHRNSMGLKLG
jgi:hypothetical protein